MTSQPTTIADIIIVADLNSVPPGYSAILKTSDTNETADLYKDGIFSKIPRFLCFATHLANNDRVISNVMIVADRQHIPPGFDPIEATRDTNEKALRKKLLCVQRSLISGGSTCISHLVLQKQKRTPAEYTLVGELDNLTLFVKYCQMPAAAEKAPDMNSLQNSFEQTRLVQHGSGAAPTSFQSSTSPQSSIFSLSGVTFQLSSRLSAGSTGGSKFDLVPMKFKSRDDLENEYSYAFTDERSILQRQFSIT